MFLLIYYTFSSTIKADCQDPNCSGHGFCVEGSCVCRKGWVGTSCDQMDHEARQCLPDCSGNGDFDLDTQKCVCRGHWSGSDCSKGKPSTVSTCNYTELDLNFLCSKNQVFILSNLSTFVLHFLCFQVCNVLTKCLGGN